MTPAPLPPVERTISVSWDPAAAFQRFAMDFGSWWPYRTHSVGRERVRRVVLEPSVGGRIYEEHVDGRRFQWGHVLAWEPPERLKFAFHPAREPETAQEVEVRFIPEGGGTRLVLTAVGWEKWGKDARKARNGYQMGWGYVLNVWAGRRTLQMTLLDWLTAGIHLVGRFRGGLAADIAKSGGEMKPS